jgi:hypothetical protein
MIVDSTRSTTFKMRDWISMTIMTLFFFMILAFLEHPLNT